MDYGPSLSATYEVSHDGSNFAYKGIAIRLDAGQGGVSRGQAWALYEHDSMRLAAFWTGREFIDWKGINFNGQHGVHPHIGGKPVFANPDEPGWANPKTQSFSGPSPHPRVKPTATVPYRLIGLISKAFTITVPALSSRMQLATPTC